MSPEFGKLVEGFKGITQKAADKKRVRLTRKISEDAESGNYESSAENARQASFLTRKGIPEIESILDSLKQAVEKYGLEEEFISDDEVEALLTVSRVEKVKKKTRYPRLRTPAWASRVCPALQRINFYSRSRNGC